MPKAFTPKVVTANHLLKGDVIYQTKSGWSRTLSDAEVLEDEAHADLRLIEASQQTGEVVGAYLRGFSGNGPFQLLPRQAGGREQCIATTSSTLPF